jgi:hypothetical protein
VVFYDRINSGIEEGKRTGERLLRLRKALEQHIP